MKRPPERSLKRPLHALTATGMIAHHAYEMAVGVGLVYQPRLGLRGAAALWSGALPGWALAAARGSARWDVPLALMAGGSAGGAVLHFVLWPWEFRQGIPVLTKAEGLRPDQLPAYNAILYAWALAGLLAVIAETPPGKRKWALIGFLGAFTQKASARHHFIWLTEQARTNPAWWNRAAGV